jgi:hypothetical protein
VGSKTIDTLHFEKYYDIEVNPLATVSDPEPANKIKSGIDPPAKHPKEE